MLPCPIWTNRRRHGRDRLLLCRSGRAWLHLVADGEVQASGGGLRLDEETLDSDLTVMLSRRSVGIDKSGRDLEVIPR
ncbi:hypothetical protein M6B38_190100 [Iris pallida]|uniref:DUF2917 domain-containing protein n=1 Tax=Iris pallida TaxID=29817 RepID=A0AAX6EFW0_IRIPA|nr:hypothetical protein M6B38_190100 [Iris pallida]